MPDMPPAMTNADIAAWFARFRHFGRHPSTDAYAAVFHPDGEVADAGMTTPTPASQVREAIAHVLRLMPDLQIDMRRYRSRGAAVFVEASNHGTINGTPVAWDAIYRVHLKDGGVYRGRRFYDQAQLFRALQPDRPQLPAGQPVSNPIAPSYAVIMPGTPVTASFAADAVIEIAGQSQPMTPAHLAAHLAAAPPRLVDWAGDATLAFIEWRSQDLLGMDRLEMANGQITALRRTFDTFGLLVARDPSFAGLRTALLSNAVR